MVLLKAGEVRPAVRQVAQALWWMWRSTLLDSPVWIARGEQVEVIGRFQSPLPCLFGGHQHVQRYGADQRSAMLTCSPSPADNPHALRQLFGLPSSLTYTHTSTPTVQLAFTSRCSQRTARSLRQRSMPAHWPWLTPESLCPVSSVAAQLV